MTRVNGFIKLDQFKDLDSYNQQKKMWINFQDKLYFLKPSNYCYAELIVEEYLKLLGLECAHYDLAIVGDEECVISEDYRKKNCHYLPGHKVLKDYQNKVGLDNYYNDIIEKDIIWSKKYLSPFNNLEIIWQALAFRYHKRGDREKIIYKLVNELKKIFFVKSLLLQDSDFHDYNWEIEESKKDIKIAPIYDNESILQFNSIGLAFTINVDSVARGLNDNLKEFLSVSSSEDVEEFINMFNKANPELFMDSIRLVEDRINSPIDENVKNDYIKKYLENYNNINLILNEYRGKHGR